MLEKLADIEKRFLDLSDKINDPEVISNNSEWRKLMKEHSDIAPIVEKYREYKETEDSVEQAREMLDDADEDMRALAKDLHISVITVQRAYEDLTRDGFIETVSGKGSFVAAQNKQFIQEEQLRIAEGLLQKVAEIGRSHGIEYQQMANILKLFYEE